MLIAFGINPSKADQQKSDATITRVIRTAEKNNYDGWLMINVCSQRTTDPKKLSDHPSTNEHRKNQSILQATLKTLPEYACLGAWGNLIDSRNYLKQYLKDLVSETDLMKQPWFCFGTTNHGHPKHPSRAGYNQFQQFDIYHYLSKL